MANDLDEIIETLEEERKRLHKIRIAAVLGKMRATSTAEKEDWIDIREDAINLYRQVSDTLVELETQRPSVQAALENIRAIAHETKQVAGEMDQTTKNIEKTQKVIESVTKLIKAASKLTAL